MWRIAAVVTLSVFLTGCFASDKPMFAPESGVRALGDGGHYATFEQSNGKEEPSDPIDVRPTGAKGYDFINEKGVPTPVTLHPLPGGEFVLQAKLEKDAGYGYILVRGDSRDMIVTPIECNKQDQAKMTTLGVTRRSDYECRIDKVKDVMAFFATAKRSPPVSRMVRE